MAGEVTVESTVGDTIRIRVWNFDTGSTNLKLPEHETGMAAKVIPLIRSRRNVPFVHLIGMASRNGSFALNQRLSEGRVNNVRAALIRLLEQEHLPFPEQRIQSFVGMGELTALNEGRPERDNSDRDRAVLIEINQSPVPVTNVRLRMPPFPSDRDAPTLRRQPVGHNFAIRGSLVRFNMVPGTESAIMNLEIWDLDSMRIASYSYQGPGVRATAFPIVPLPGSINFTGKWNCFDLNGAIGAEDFGGAALFERFAVATEESIVFKMLGSTVVGANRGLPLVISPLLVGEGVGSFNLASGQANSGVMLLRGSIAVSDASASLGRSELAPSCALQARRMHNLGGRVVR